jgi:hypothetical protein
MVKDLPTMVAAAKADVPAEEETLPAAEERPAQELVAEPAATLNDIQVPTWNLGKRILIAPQVWDADTPQIGVGRQKTMWRSSIWKIRELHQLHPNPHGCHPRKRGRSDGRERRREMRMAGWPSG